MQFLKKLKNGEYSLAKTYWLYGVAYTSCLIILFSFMGLSPRNSIIAPILIFTYKTFVLLGVWRAADKYTGRHLWVTLAKAAVLINSGVLIYSVSKFLLWLPYMNSFK